MRRKRHRPAAVSVGVSTILFAAFGAFAASVAGFAEAPPAETAGGLLIDTTDWDDLSRQVIPHVLESTLDMGTVLRYARSASCTVDVSIKTPQLSMPELGNFVVPAGPPSTSRLTLSWEDANDDGTLDEEEVKAETGHTSDIMMKLAAEQIEKGLRNLVLLNFVNLLSQSSVKSEKKGEVYEITVNPKKGPAVPLRLTVASDFRIIGTEFRALGAVDTKSTFKYVKKDDKWFLAETETTTDAGTPRASSEKSAVESRMEDGIPLVARITLVGTSSTGSGTLRTEQEYAFSNWRVVKRERPIELVAGPITTGEAAPEAAKTDTVVAQPPSRVSIPRSEQAKKLAGETLFSVGNAYYDLSAAGVTGYEATFALQRNGGTVGSFRLKWDAFGGISVEAEPGSAEEMKGLAETLGRQVGGVVAGGPLSDYSLASDVYAARSANHTVIDATQHTATSHPNVQSDVVLVSPDLRRIRATRTMANGETSERQYDGEESEGKLFVSSTTDTVSDPGTPPQRTECTWTYTKKFGEPFVRSLEWSGTAAGQTGNWAMLVQSVAFRKEVAQVRVTGTKDGEIPRNSQTMKCGSGVYDKLAASYYNLSGDTKVAAFDVVYALKLDDEPLGTMNVVWDGRKGFSDTITPPFPFLVSRIQVTFNPLPGAAVIEETATTVRHFGEGVFSVVAERPFPFAANVYGVKSGNETTIDVTQFYGLNPSVKKSLTYASEDLCRIRNVTSYTDGNTVETLFEGEVVQGKHYMSKVTLTKPAPDSPKREYILTYTRTEGVPFVKRAVLETSSGGTRTSLKAELQSVTFEKKE